MKNARRRIRSRDFRYLLAFATISVIVSSGFAYLVLSPQPSEKFFVIYVLGPSGLANDYYPDDNPNLKVGEQMNWTLGVYNHMASLEYVVIRVKMLNSTQAGPDESIGTPSRAAQLFELGRILTDNETWSMPFVWEVSKVARNPQSLSITGMSVNQNSLSGEFATASFGFNYRLIFELWYFDDTKNQLVFSSPESEATAHPVWVEMWFNVTMPAQ